MSNMHFYKENKKDKIWWVKNDNYGVWEFSFDRKQIFNLFQDYPYKLTPEQKTLFDAENPYLGGVFQRQKVNNK